MSEYTWYTGKEKELINKSISQIPLQIHRTKIHFKGCCTRDLKQSGPYPVIFKALI